MKNDLPHLVIFENEKFIANPSNDNIKKLVYSTKSILLNDEDIFHTDQVFFKINNLYSNSMVKIEDVDPMEDGTIIYILEEIEIDDFEKSYFKPCFLEEKTYYKKTFFKERKEPFFSIQNCKITHTKTTPGYVQKKHK